MTSEWTNRGTAHAHFRVGELATDLTARTDAGQSLGLTAKRDLDRYYYLLRLSLPTFSIGEASLIVDALNGTLTEPHTASLLWAGVSDALEDGLAQKWGVNGEALVARLRALTPFEALAVCDAAERFWLVSSRAAPGDTIEDYLRTVGLVR